MDTHENSKAIQPDRAPGSASENVVTKKPFVEPEISVPIDVLEATTFQQPVTSGATN